MNWSNAKLDDRDPLTLRTGHWSVPGELHIDPFCAPQRMDAETPAAVHIGGSGTCRWFVGTTFLVPLLYAGREQPVS